MRQRQQAEHRRPARQRLRHLLHEKQILRPGQQVLAGNLAPRVDTLLDVGEELRSVLYFVNDQGRREAVQEGTGIGGDRGAQIRWIERDVAESLFVESSEERGLARLPRSRDDDDRKRGRQAEARFPESVSYRPVPAAQSFVQVCI